MTEISIAQPRLGKRHLQQPGSLWPVAALALAGLLLSLALPATPLRIALLSSSVAALAVTGVFWALSLGGRRRQAVLIAALRTMASGDRAAVILTDEGGSVRWRNPAAARAADGENAGLRALLAGLFAAPAAVQREMIAEAMSAGMASRDRASRNGHLRLSVFRSTDRLFLWRLEDVSPWGAGPGALDLGLPVAVFDPAERLVAQNAAFAAEIGHHRTLASLIADPPLISGAVHLVRGAAGPRRHLVHVVDAEAGGRELYFLPAAVGGAGDPAALFDTLPVPLLKLARDGRIEMSNRGARALLGSDVPAGARLSDLLSGLGRPVRDWLEEAASGRGPNRSEFLQVTASRSDRFVQVSLKRIEEGEAPALLAVLTDATELKTLEAQFVQSQKMQAIGQLAGGVAHDFNNLLTAISGHCDLLLLRHEQGDPDYGDLVQIHQNANRAASLVGQLLAFSRKQTLQPEILDLRDTLSELTHLLNRLVGERVRLILRHGESLPPIRVDKRKLEQVIMNLVVNARDAMPDGGEVTLASTCQTLKTELSRNRARIPPGEYVVIRVEDEGIGIPQDQVAKIFEPFFTTKKTGEGTGLGLSTAYGIIKQTGGFIFADSVEGVGTTFTIYLPAHHAEARPAERPSLPPPLPAAGGVVLLVEDEAPVRAFASRALKLQGLTVLEAESAEEALDLLSDPALEVDVFVTDVVMPGLDGPTWVRQALQTRPDTRVVFVSGYAREALCDQDIAVPNAVFLPKPFSLKDLTETVQRQLG